MKSKDDLRKQRESKVIDEKSLITFLKNGKQTVREMSKRFDVPIVTVQNTLSALAEMKVMVRSDNGEYYIDESPEEGSRRTLNADMWQGDTLRYGFISDNHLGAILSALRLMKPYMIYLSPRVSRQSLMGATG